MGESDGKFLKEWSDVRWRAAVPIRPKSKVERRVTNREIRNKKILVRK